MVVQKKDMETYFMFKEFLSFFIKSIIIGISQSNHHLLILDGHGSHVILEAITITKWGHSSLIPVH